MPKKVFYGDDVIEDATGWPQSFSLYSCLGEVGTGSKLQCLVNKCQYHNCLSRLYMPKTISMNNTFRDCKSKSSSQAYWMTLALISSIANYLKYNYFWDCDGIDNVTLRLWKFWFLLNTHCRRRGWWYHVPHSSSALHMEGTSHWYKAFSWGNDILGTSRWMLQNPIDDISTLAQEMTRCRYVRSHRPSQYWPRSMSPYGVNQLCFLCGLLLISYLESG